MVKAVVQRVRRASVTVDGKQISAIGRGLMILVGIGTKDTTYELDWLAGKLLNARLFPDSAEESWGWKRNVMEIEAEVLCVSQFTLCANVRKGNKPDFHGALAAETSKVMYEQFLSQLRKSYRADRIFDGEFGAMMDVSLVNDGPATIIFDSTTDAPAPKPPPLSFEEKRARRQEMAKKAQSSEQASPAPEEQSERNGEGGKLADRFKAAMMEQY